MARRRSDLRRSAERLLLVTGLVAALLAAGCAPLAPRLPAKPVCPPRGVSPKPAPTQARYEPRSFAQLPGWGQADLATSLRAFVKGCARVSNEGPLQATCWAAQALPTDDSAVARQFFETSFIPYRIIAPDGSTKGLITGYYEPVLTGSRTRSRLFRYPVYGVPRNLVVVDLASQYPQLKGLRLRGRIDGHRLVPYYSRAQIARFTRASLDGVGGGLPAPILAWVSDPIDLFFLQIQGSGQIRLLSGKRIRLGYADENGYPYRSLGEYLIEEGELTPGQVSMQAIKAWARTHPKKLPQALDYNASYVFFRELPASQPGPLGALGVALTPGYSVAVDATYVPLATPVFLSTTYPQSTRPLDRLVVAQDTGGAIGGALRTDLYWGSGNAAGALAGRMKQPGRLWLLWPKGVKLPDQ